MFSLFVNQWGTEKYCKVYSPNMVSKVNDILVSPESFFCDGSIYIIQSVTNILKCVTGNPNCYIVLLWQSITAITIEVERACNASQKHKIVHERLFCLSTLGGDTVVTHSRHMSNQWTPTGDAKTVQSAKVTDFVKAGGTNYNLFLANCHDASKKMMQNK